MLRTQAKESRAKHKKAFEEEKGVDGLIILNRSIKKTLEEYDQVLEVTDGTKSLAGDLLRLLKKG